MVHHDQGTACGTRGPTHCSAAFTSLAIHSCLVVTGVNTQGSYHYNAVLFNVFVTTQ